MTDIVVLVPGIMGSTLALNGTIIWPGTPTEYLFNSYPHFTELLADHLEPKDVIRSVSIRDVYGSLLVGLRDCGFDEGLKPPTLYCCPYDWRKSNALAAERLAGLVTQAVKEHGNEVRITLIAHSMGGLVARYYLESDEFKGKDGFDKVVRLITLATPHRGAPVALPAVLGLEKRVWLDAPQVQRLANDDRFPSLYELLPPRDEPFVWRSSAEGEHEPIDIHDDTIADRLRLNKNNLKKAREFHERLDLRRRPNHVRYFAFGGTAHVTVSAVTLLSRDGGFEPQRVDPAKSGDETVPIWSAPLPGHQGLPVGGPHAHDVLFRDGNLRRTLAVLLGKKGVLAGEAEGVEVALREHVVHPSQLVPVVLRLPPASAPGARTGRLGFERASFDDKAQLQGYTRYGATSPIRLTSQAGAEDTLSVTVEAPDIKGAYRVAFFWGQDEPPAGQPEPPAGQDELFVQQPAPVSPA